MSEQARTPRRACWPKRHYRSRIDAAFALADCRDRGRNEWRVYRCPQCKGWHLTSQEKRSADGDTGRLPAPGH